MDKETGWILGAGLVGAAGLFLVWWLRQDRQRREALATGVAPPAGAEGGDAWDILTAANTAGCAYITKGQGGSFCAAVGQASTAATKEAVKQGPGLVRSVLSIPSRIFG